MQDSELRQIEKRVRLYEAIASDKAVCHDRGDRVAVSVSVGTKVYNLIDLEKEIERLNDWIPQVEEHCVLQLELWHGWLRAFGKQAGEYMAAEGAQNKLLQGKCHEAQRLLDRLKASEQVLQGCLLKHRRGGVVSSDVASSSTIATDEENKDKQLAVAQAKVLQLRRRSKYAKRPSAEDLRALADQCRFSNGRINYSQLGKKFLGYSHVTAKKWCDESGVR